MDLHGEVLKGFNLKATNIKKVKGMYVCNTNRGTKIIKVTNQPLKKIEDSQKVAKILKENNINTFDKYDVSNSGLPYFTYRDDVYVCSDYINSEKNDFSCEKSFLEAVEMLAMFHKATKKTDILRPICISEDLLYKKNIGKLKNIKKRVTKQNKFSNFDISFIKNYEKYLSDVEKSFDMLSTDYFNKQSMLAEDNRSLLHNLVKGENFINLNNNAYINNFYEIKNNVQIIDLGEMIQRHIKLSNDNFTNFQLVLETYNRINPITIGDAEIVKATVIYPKRFVKTILSYYTKNRTWTPTGLENKLDEELTRRGLYHSYISGF